MRLNVMLVDDEIHILKNLNMVIPWEMLDMQVVSLAQNGAEAWAAFQEHRPDLILSDIRMPIMDGVSLVKEIRDAGEACEVIMLTGFTDFEYTRSAIRYGVKDYIVKPINYQELHEVIERVGGEIRQRKQARLLEEKVWREFTELAKQKYLFDALMGQAAGHSHYTITGKTQTWGRNMQCSSPIWTITRSLLVTGAMRNATCGIFPCKTCSATAFPRLWEKRVPWS